MSSKSILTQGTIELNESIEVWAKEFILDRRLEVLVQELLDFTGKS